MTYPRAEQDGSDNVVGIGEGGDVFSIRNGAKLLRGPKVSSTVVLLGITSLLTDVSSEMVLAVLPIFLINWWIRAMEAARPDPRHAGGHRTR